MPSVEFWLLGLLAVGLALAAWSLQAGRARRRGILPVATLVFLGISAAIAAAHRTETLIYLGLAAGGFVAAISWD
jgi:hypothetical protein